MTWPFENDTGAIVKKLAKRSFTSEKRRNLMVVVAVALAAFLICLSAVISVSVEQIQRNQVADTYEAVFDGMDESGVAALKELPEFARVGEYYLLGQEHSEQGYNASYVYCDSDMVYIARSQMELVKGELPVQANEVAVSEYFLSAYGSNAKIGETVRLDTGSFHGGYTVTGILSNVGEANLCAVAVSKEALTQWAGFDPAGYRAYVHFKNDRQFEQETMASHCREIAAQFGSAHAELCEYLNCQGIPCCHFLRNNTGNFLSTDANGRLFHVQKFIEGRLYGLNEALDWLLIQSAQMLGKIHAILKNYPGLPVGIGADFFQCMIPKRALKSYENSLSVAESRGDTDIAADLRYCIELMKRFPDYVFDLNKLTCHAMHGDYFISQILCGDGKINAVIDWTTACVHPVVWEIVRSYVYAAPSCKNGEINMNEFASCVSEYQRFAALNEYDLQCMIPLFYYQIAVCDYYGHYYASTAANRHIYLHQAIFSTKLLRWLEKDSAVVKSLDSS